MQQNFDLGLKPEASGRDMPRSRFDFSRFAKVVTNFPFRRFCFDFWLPKHLEQETTKVA